MEVKTDLGSEEGRWCRARILDTTRKGDPSIIRRRNIEESFAPEVRTSQQGGSSRSHLRQCPAKLHGKLEIVLADMLNV